MSLFHSAKRQKTNAVRGKLDWRILVIALLLVAIGFMMCFSSSSYTSAIKGSPYSEIRSQMRGLVLGLVLMLVLSQIDYHLYNHPFVVFTAFGLSALLLLVLRFLPQSDFIVTAPIINNARRWIRIKSLSIQPSELAKFAVILFLSARLSVKVERAQEFKYTLLPCCVFSGIMFLLIMIGPDLSTGACVLLVTLFMLYYGGTKKRYVLLLIAGGLLVASLYILSSPMRQERMLAFLDPENYTGDAADQLRQSLYAFGNGGAFGVGLGQSRQKLLFLPYAYSDFVFAIVGEELGFFGSAAVLLLFLGLVWFGIQASINCVDRFGMLLGSGIVTLIAVQVVMNIAVVIGFIPTTGIPLPFFTAGSTSLTVFMGSIGVLLSVSRYRRPQHEKKEEVPSETEEGRAIEESGKKEGSLA